MVAGAAVNVCSVVTFLLAFFPGHSQTAACGFASLSYMGSCTLSCPQGLIADASSRECRDVKSTDIHPDGYTVNATKYEAVAFVDDATMMVPGGTYLLTIEVIPTELDTTKVEEFITTINGTGTEMLDFQGALGATTNQVVLRTINPIPPGKHSFTVGLKPFSFDLPGPFTTLDREVELWILPPAQPCSTMLCSNGGQCSDVMIVEVETFSCNCTSGWTGPTCSEDIDFCASQPCMHGGTCIDTGDGYTCMCSHVYTGPDCAAIDYCAVNVPCQNDGHCVNTANTYSCVCVGGWTGKNCTDDVDECTTSDPCVNGVCNNTDGGYGCTCNSGWTGKNCTDDVDECHQLSPCQNGGTCINIDGSYNCSCPPLYTGAHCEEFMPCKSNSCDPTPPSTRTNATPWPTNRIIDTALSAGFVGISIFLFLTISIFACAIGCYRRKRCCCKRRMRTPSSCARPSIHNPAFGTPEAQNWILLEKKMMM